MQFRDLKKQYIHLKTDIDTSIQSVLEDAHFIQGDHVRQLEIKLAEYVGRKHCIACANGTDALQLVLMAWGIGHGDAVFTSDFTFFASAGTASIVGATPVFVDIDQHTFNISPDMLEESIKRVIAVGKLRPKAIIPVDLFGLPADYDRIEMIAKKYDLRILEDGAQGFGGQRKGRFACSFGDAATTSFFPAKPLGCYGDGGAIFTDDDELEVQIRSLQAQGRSPSDKYDNRVIGINSRLDTLQAAILLPKLTAFADYELDAVNDIASQYSEYLADIVTVPVIPDGYYSSWAQYSILVREKGMRDVLQADLKQLSIPSMIYYPRGLHQQSAYKDMNLSDESFSNTVYATKHILSLPMHPYLEKEEIQRVVEAVRKSLAK